ncbi:MAG: hypothetical protein JEY91_07145 [Spirochaetaceae bacterium]|nr:hypothetical protein [Spirochaetaceae bacterium]
MKLSTQGSKTITIKNEGNGELNISNIAISGDSEFAVTHDLTFPLVIGFKDSANSVEIQVSFSPVDLTACSTVITVSSDDEDEENFIVNFSGTGLSGTAPTPGNSGTLDITDVEENTLTLAWTRATDVESPQSALEYKVVYSESVDISTVASANAVASGFVLFDWGTFPTSVAVDSLIFNTDYYFAVIVRDEVDNMALYTMTLQKTARDPRLYWAEEGTSKSIKRCKLDGTDVETIVTGLNEPRDLAIDDNGEYLYWADTGTQSIQRVNLEGTQVKTTLYDNATDSVDAPWEIVLDNTNNLIYWTDKNTGEIYQGNIDGSGSPIVVLTGLSDPTGLAIDFTGEIIYWSESPDSTSTKISKTDLPITSTVTIVNYLDDGVVYPYSIDIDLNQNYLYWTETVNVSGKVNRILTSDSDYSILDSDLLFPWGIYIYIDSTGDDFVFWTNRGLINTGSINSINLTTLSTNLVLSSLASPSGITIY